jgi:hypothetical protein
MLRSAFVNGLRPSECCARDVRATHGGREVTNEAELPVIDDSVSGIDALGQQRSHGAIVLSDLHHAMQALDLGDDLRIDRQLVVDQVLIDQIQSQLEFSLVCYEELIDTIADLRCDTQGKDAALDLLCNHRSRIAQSQMRAEHGYIIRPLLGIGLTRHGVKRYAGQERSPFVGLVVAASHEIEG